MAISELQASGKIHRHLRAGSLRPPELARWLVEQGIDNLSLNPDSVVETWMFLASPANTAPHAEVHSGSA